jgi:Mrp family chromosome partitioning ATPase
LSVTTYLSEASSDGNWGAVLVSTPQEVSLLDVRKQLTFCKKMKIPIIGVIENMSSFVCPNCTTESKIFPNNSSELNSTEQMCTEMDVKFLGKLPLDPKLTRCCDEGRNFVIEFSDNSAVSALKEIVGNIRKHFNDIV